LALNGETTLSSTPPRILILDDEEEMRALLQRYLSGQGFSVALAASAYQLDALLAAATYDVLVLDLMMPDESGLSICKRLRAAGNTIPIMMLTAKGDPVDRVIGIDTGADDYLGKPFEPSELAARLHAMVRRQKMHAQPAPEAEESVTFGPFQLDFTRRTLVRDGVPVPLAGAEFALLRALARNPHQALRRDSLMALAAGGSGRRSDMVTERSVDVQILRLRRLIEPDAAAPCFIQTVWGVGYRFVPDGTVP
jgi:two-component system phosphate regulon response regulator OmpR